MFGKGFFYYYYYYLYIYLSLSLIILAFPKWRWAFWYLYYVKIPTGRKKLSVRLGWRDDSKVPHFPARPPQKLELVRFFYSKHH